MASLQMNFKSSDSGLYKTNFSHTAQSTGNSDGPISYLASSVSSQMAWHLKYVGIPSTGSNLASLFLALETILIFFFCPESTYRRADDLNIDLGTTDHVAHHREKDNLGVSQPQPIVEEWTFWQLLRPWRGIES